ncbi:hypothetical protein FRC03_007702 [Tulasnella sp. 419]|nr:hypothetical protein FRC03_007702 [Tulasnella sp. 419]
MATKQKIDADVIDGYELCTDPLLCGASRAKNYSGELDWRLDIALWTEKVAKLRR